MPNSRTQLTRLKQALSETLEAQQARQHAHERDMLAKLNTQAASFEMRYQCVVAKYYHALESFETSKREVIHLRQVVQAKQQLIEVLLPYYPHPLTAEQQRTVALR